MEADVRRAGLVRAPQNLAAGLSLVALTAFSLWAGRNLPHGTLRSMGPGMMPRAIAVLMGAIGVGLVIASLVRQGDRIERWSFRGPLLITAGVLAFAITIRSPGLLVAGPLVSMVGGAAAPDVRPKELFVFGLVMTVFCAGLFRYALQLPIPILVIPGVVVL